MSSTLDPKITAMAAKMAKKTPEEQRDLMQTLLALDVPLDKAAGLVSENVRNSTRAALTEYAWMIREYRAKQLPEGSEARRRLEMVADMIDPSTPDSWEYPTAGGGGDVLV